MISVARVSAGSDGTPGWRRVAPDERGKKRNGASVTRERERLMRPGAALQPLCRPHDRGDADQRRAPREPPRVRMDPVDDRRILDDQLACDVPEQAATG